MAHRSPEVAPDPTSTFPCIPICKSERVLLARASAVWQTTNLLRVRACCVEIHHLRSIDSIRRPVTSWIVRVIARRDTVSNKVRNRWVVVDDEVPQHSHERKDEILAVIFSCVRIAEIRRSVRSVICIRDRKLIFPALATIAVVAICFSQPVRRADEGCLSVDCDSTLLLPSCGRAFVNCGWPVAAFSRPVQCIWIDRCIVHWIV